MANNVPKKDEWGVARLNRAVQDAIISKRGKAKGNGKISYDQQRIIESAGFKQGIADAKKFLPLTNKDLFEKADEETVLNNQMCHQIQYWLTSDDRKTVNVDMITSALLLKLQLGEGWHKYVRAVILDEELPSAIDNDFIQVVEVYDDTTVLLALNKGITKQEYIDAWEGLQDILDRPLPINYYSENTLAQRMVTDHYRKDGKGLTIRQIATRYKITEENAKQIVRRQKRKK